MEATVGESHSPGFQGRSPWLYLAGTRLRRRGEALRPLLIVHSFRFIGLAFFVLESCRLICCPAFAHSAALGDIIGGDTCVVATIAAQCSWCWHRVDLQCLGFSRSRECVLPGQSCRAVGGAVGGGLLHSDFASAASLITHGLAFRILQHENESATTKAGSQHNGLTYL